MKFTVIVIIIIIIMVAIIIILTQWPGGLFSQSIKTQVAIPEKAISATVRPSAYDNVSLQGISENIEGILSGGSPR